MFVASLFPMRDCPFCLCDNLGAVVWIDALDRHNEDVGDSSAYSKRSCKVTRAAARKLANTITLPTAIKRTVQRHAHSSRTT
jgi:hypothetical protein